MKTYAYQVPSWVEQHSLYPAFSDATQELRREVKNRLSKFAIEKPVLATIILPAYNEEANLFRTLASLSALDDAEQFELIVANNNSTDSTQEILDSLGVKSVFVKQQGVSYARQAALEMATGSYVLSADADSLYPRNWGADFIRVLSKRPEVACVHGKYAFLPNEIQKRWWLKVREMGTGTAIALRSKKHSYLNVMGCNAAYRREQALAIGGYDHAQFESNGQRGEGGFLALKLMERFGKICYVPSKERVWTSSRRLVSEGSPVKVFLKRLKRYVMDDFNPMEKIYFPDYRSADWSTR